MNRKGQSALEYLMTYGWALLVIVIVVAALFAMGILNPATYTQSTCSGFSKLAYVDHALTTGTEGDSFKIKIRNGQAASINIADMDVYIEGEQRTNNATIYAGTGILSPEKDQELAAGFGITARGVSSGDSYKAFVNITYQVIGGVTTNHTESAICSGKYV